ncbi:hypothetical protein SOVF_122090 [Spinacia oleracea]|nr:hypothetical protein SOVF_122090 [Spinacia oleracea]
MSSQERLSLRWLSKERRVTCVQRWRQRRDKTEVEAAVLIGIRENIGDEIVRQFADSIFTVLHSGKLGFRCANSSFSLCFAGGRLAGTSARGVVSEYGEYSFSFRVFF